MPTYTYRCSNCSNTFEEIHTISDRMLPESAACTECGEHSIKQIIVPGAAGSISKGSKESLSKLDPPSWFAEKVNNLNKDYGSKVTAGFEQRGE